MSAKKVLIPSVWRRDGKYYRTTLSVGSGPNFDAQIPEARTVNIARGEDQELEWSLRPHDAIEFAIKLIKEASIILESQAKP